jgi:radical SAM enzyme (TIGR01210 family)
MAVSSAFLKAVMRKVYEARSSLPPEQSLTVLRHEVADGKPLYVLWFMTQGCTHDRNGGCTMCNYGKGWQVDPALVLDSIKSILDTLPSRDYELIVNPSGSFLDEYEVPLSLRNKIYQLLKNTHFETLTIESRADTLRTETLEELKTQFPDKHISFEIGVETLNNYLLKYAVNKGITIHQIEQSVNFIHGLGFTAIANIGLGLPFINEKENIIQTKKSVLKAYAMGFDEIILFPYQIKPGTLLEFLQIHGRYRCTSLWSLIEVLSQLPLEYLPKVNISWYKNYYTDKRNVIEVANTCPVCHDDVLLLLDKYKANPCKETLSALENFSCVCKREWRNRLEFEKDGIDRIHIQNDYRFLADYFQIAPDLLDGALKELEEFDYA